VRTFPNLDNKLFYNSLNHKILDEFTSKLITKAEIISFQGITFLEKEFEEQEEIRIDLGFDL